MTSEIYQQAAELLGQIEHVMQQQALWQASPPKPEALASSAPFCCDTLSFPQWLQFILLPRMRALIDAHRPLPTAVAIAPMAEETLAAEHQALIRLLEAFDQLLSGQER